MSESRFRFLLRVLRFDDVRDRQIRQETDRLAAIHQIITIMLQKCKNYYTPSEYLTMDEQLVAFKGCCGFVQYMLNKPVKFGIKIIMVVHVKYPYVYNLEIYYDMQPEGPYRVSNKVPDIIHRILSPLYGSGCNVTMDNWFTSVPTCKELLTKNITTVGTLKKNKPEIPDQFKTTQDKAIKESIFGFQSDCALVSYVPKPKKVVLLLSTLHNDNKIDPNSGESKKPEVITFYNHTKYGVDIFDKMCRQYNVSRNSRRWPVTLFYNFINLAGINGLIIYQMNNPGTKTIRHHYLQEVGFELARPYIEHRISMRNIP
ncbi:PiggyBac transposable element-derived protein 4 [Eumeta japonica]|uniref:PiggyBac transposable element-derived protein 4 n=1 Tax=Eumeta variegata TaxID=151549 RepID=A0A4C1W9L4_EUMVA|nr:PiggyBac transposable element-derived protein 4 [Eumeta japonica]